VPGRRAARVAREEVDPMEEKKREEKKDLGKKPDKEKEKK
jgi:hypothetical protein